MTQETHDLTIKMETRAQALVNAMAKHEYRNGIVHFNSNMTSLMSAEKLEEMWNGILSKEGAFVEQVSGKYVNTDGNHGIILLCKFEKGSLDIYVTFDATANISGLHFGPPPAAHAAAPAKADPAANKTDDAAAQHPPAPAH